MLISNSFAYRYLTIAALFLAILLPRVVELDQFMTPDERLWLVRSANFYQALADGDFAHTFQREHPGVTTMWAGTLGFLLRYPSYAEEAPGQFDWHRTKFEQWVRQESDQVPLLLFVAGRFFVVLLIALCLSAVFILTSRLVGQSAAWCGFGLIAFDPFHVGLSRLLHVDGLLSSFMLLSLLAFVSYLYDGRRTSDLLLSAVMMGLAWLTKSPALFLLPFVGLLVLIASHREWEKGARQGLLRLIGSLFPWIGVALIIFVLFWPAMWVEPLESIEGIFSQASDYATVGHNNVLYFNGRAVVGDLGPTFYPISYLWRSTPIVLIGLALASVAFMRRYPPFDQHLTRQLTVALALFAFFFTLFMTLGAKKFDRYLLPIYAPLDLVAGLGWFSVVRWMMARSITAGWHHLARKEAIIITLLLFAQLLGTLATAPYYLTYYNPLLGGSSKAVDVMMIGWGEGLDQAARYLNGKPNADKLVVRAWYSRSFSYFFEGQTLPIDPAPKTNEDFIQWLSADYLVFYLHQWQRQLPNPDLMAYFFEQVPEETIYLNGLPYARLYNLREGQLLDYLGIEQSPITDWGQAIRLIGYQVSKTKITSSQTIEITFYLNNIAPLERDLNVLVRLFDSQGQEWARSEGWPRESATSSWRRHEIWLDSHQLSLPAEAPAGDYHIELTFYDSTTWEHLPAIELQSGEPIGDSLIVEQIVVSD